MGKYSKDFQARFLGNRKRVIIMKCLTLRADNKMDYTTVSNIFIDNFMPQANGEFVKVYLYLLRCMSDPNMDISISSIADRFDHTEKDVIRALRYFAGKGLLSIEYGEDDELSAVTFLPINSEITLLSNESKSGSATSLTRETTVSSGQPLSKEVVTPSVIAPEETVINDEVAIPEKKALTPTQLKKLTQNEEISELLYITEKYLGKTLTNSDTNTVLYMYDSLHFSSELIEYLIEYCVTNNHKSMRYIETVALSWAKDGIDTVQKAKDNTSLYTSKIFSIMKAFGLTNRGPAEAEKKLINKWYNDYCFDNEIILEACNRTIRAIHSPSFEYADSILTKWKEHDVKTLKDIEAIDQAVPVKPVKIFTAKTAGNGANNGSNNKFNAFPHHNYDFDLLEKKIMEE